MNIQNKNFFYQDVAESIVDSIMSLVSQGIKEFESYESWPYNIPISCLDENYNHFNWSYKICRSDQKNFTNDQYDIVGSAGRDCFDEPSIELGIIIPQGKHQKKIRINRSELYDVVAHELHHLAQNIDNNQYKRNTKEKGKLSYFLDPYEIEAFHIGIRAQSALSGKTFQDISEDYLSKAWPEGSKEDRSRIIKVWAETKFPAFKQNLINNNILERG